MLKRLAISVVLILVPSVLFAQQTSGRTDIFYDSGRNVVFATASLNPDYNTQYYDSLHVVTNLYKKGIYANAYGVYDGPGPASTYVETPAESGVEVVAETWNTLVNNYQYYEIYSPCDPSCNDWYDAYGYISISGGGDPYISTGTSEGRIWTPPYLIMLILTETIFLEKTMASTRAPGEKIDFQITANSFIPPLYVFDPSLFCQGSYGTQSIIYKGDNRTYDRWASSRTRNEVTLVPDAGTYTTKTPSVGLTKGYAYPTGVGTDSGGHEVLLEDDVWFDCYKFQSSGQASTSNMHIDVSGVGAELWANAHIYGFGCNPLNPNAPCIDWNLNVEVSKQDPTNPIFYIDGYHDCYPAHEVYIGLQRIHEWMPSSNSASYIAFCLAGGGPVNITPHTGTIYY